MKCFILPFTSAFLFILLQGGKSELLVPDGTYNREFFQQHLQYKGSFSILADVLISYIRPKDSSSDTFSSSIVDVGCGHGLLVESIRDQSDDAIEAYCLEGSRDASFLWPKAAKDVYYTLVDITSPEATSVIPKTEYVASFETAEHIPSWGAEDFVHLLTLHGPKAVFFGAATENQDQGKNPTHVNENSLKYWVDMFNSVDYKLDAVMTFFFRKQMLEDPRNAVQADSILNTWWYPKNSLIFIPNNATLGSAMIPSEKLPDILHMIGLLGTMMSNHPNGAFHELWKRDWDEFELLFQQQIHNEHPDKEEL